MPVTPIRVLLVDGDPDFLPRIQGTLRSEPGAPFTFERANCLSRAVKMVEQGHDVAIVNLMLPDAKGISTLRKLRQAAPALPVLALTDTDDKRAFAAALRGGAQDYLTKDRLDGPGMARSIRYAIERRQVEQELIRAKAAAEAASRAKSEFLANMSHEIRTPMTAILGFAECLLEPELPRAEFTAAVQTIRRNGEYLLDIIHDILDLSKIEANQMQTDSVAFSPRELLLDVADLLRVRAESKGLRIDVETPDDLPPQIRTDALRLRQILINLVGNAVKFTEQGGVRIVARMAHTGDPGPRLEVEVIDTGVGMTPQALGRLFRPFTQADATTSRRYGGTGLGLTISKRLARLLDGDITATSRPGKGSCFRVSVATAPLHAATVAPMEDVAPADPERGPLNARLLLAEDAPDTQRLLRRILTKAGARITVVENGEQAVKAALAGETGDRPYDLILMDMHMPVMDGYQASAALRAKGYPRPIVALTANAMTGDRERCLAAGCSDFETKPIDRAHLLAAVRRSLGASQDRARRAGDDLALDLVCDKTSVSSEPIAG